MEADYCVLLSDYSTGFKTTLKIMYIVENVSSITYAPIYVSKGYSKMWLLFDTKMCKISDPCMTISKRMYLQKRHKSAIIT